MPNETPFLLSTDDKNSLEEIIQKISTFLDTDELIKHKLFFYPYPSTIEHLIKQLNNIAHFEKSAADLRRDNKKKKELLLVFEEYRLVLMQILLSNVEEHDNVVLPPPENKKADDPPPSIWKRIGSFLFPIFAACILFFIAAPDGINGLETLLSLLPLPTPVILSAYAIFIAISPILFYLFGLDSVKEALGKTVTKKIDPELLIAQKQIATVTEINEYLLKNATDNRHFSAVTLFNNHIANKCLPYGDEHDEYHESYPKKALRTAVLTIGIGLVAGYTYFTSYSAIIALVSLFAGGAVFLGTPVGLGIAISFGVIAAVLAMIVCYRKLNTEAYDVLNPIAAQRKETKEQLIGYKNQHYQPKLDNKQQKIMEKKSQGEGAGKELARVKRCAAKLTRAPQFFRRSHSCSSLGEIKKDDHHESKNHSHFCP